ncbi:MAG: NupC/NupG family nucleoside CNT transporter [Planctomycetes bacterium]|nr:NupC/NupG family nucleoside CNT transporter [Planctomycetota bacterium]
MPHFTGLLGVGVLLLIAYALSTNRNRINVRTVLSGVAIQFVIAYLFLSFPPVVRIFDYFAAGVTKVISFADQGTVFIFGKAADASGPWGFIFAVKVLPIIIFFASLMAVLYHLGVMQRLVAVLAWIIRRALNVTGVEALSASANIFVGQTEAPLTVKPFIATMTRSQIMAVMTVGFATIAGSVMAAYIVMLGGEDNAARIVMAKHLMTASVMSAPAGLVMAKIMLPETEIPRDETLDSLRTIPRTTCNVMDAAAEGATDGLKLALNVAAMLVAFVALLALLNYPLTALSEIDSIASWRAAHGIPVLTFQNILGYVFTPLAWCMGVGSEDARKVGSLMGEQVIATEFVAYVDLSTSLREGTIGFRAAEITTYALCGFANLPSIAIQIGGLSAMAPQRRGDFAQLGLRAMTAGALACWMTGAIASMFIKG